MKKNPRHRIAKEHLNGLVNTQDGIPTQYSIDLQKIEFDDEEARTTVLGYAKVLRTLLRAQSNIRASCNILEELKSRLVGRHPRASTYDHANSALLAHASTLYGACFVKGENNLPPLRALEVEIEKKEIHKRLRNLRDKFFGHIDADNEHRSDSLVWKLMVKEDSLEPLFGSLTGSKVLMLNLVDIEEWYEHNRFVLNLIGEKAKELETSINKIVGPLKEY